MRSHYFIAPEFFKWADEMRKAYDDHFYENHRSFSPGQRVWDYMHQPGKYTYLKTIPERIIPLATMNLFMKMLQSWSFELLGTMNVSRPVLALYFNGFGETLHYNTGSEGWAYEFSLTPGEKRTFYGGDLILWKESDYWESDNMSLATGGTAFFDAIAPIYNQLVVFDDRIKHSISTIEGQMQPENGRLVLQGYIPYGDIYCYGYLKENQIKAVLSESLPRLSQQLSQQFGGVYHGALCLRMGVSSQGEVEQIQVINDRILKTADGGAQSQILSQAILTFLQSLRFPNALDKTAVTLTLLINMGDGSQLHHLKLEGEAPMWFPEAVSMLQSHGPHPAKAPVTQGIRPHPAKAPTT
jgi:hypothetical protein